MGWGNILEGMTMVLPPGLWGFMGISKAENCQDGSCGGPPLWTEGKGGGTGSPERGSWAFPHHPPHRPDTQGTFLSCWRQFWLSSKDAEKSRPWRPCFDSNILHAQRSCPAPALQGQLDSPVGWLACLQLPCISSRKICSVFHSQTLSDSELLFALGEYVSSLVNKGICTESLF